jgi:hypothetical protein
MAKANSGGHIVPCAAIIGPAMHQHSRHVLQVLCHAIRSGGTR